MCGTWPESAQRAACGVGWCLGIPRFIPLHGMVLKAWLRESSSVCRVPPKGHPHLRAASAFCRREEDKVVSCFEFLCQCWLGRAKEKAAFWPHCDFKGFRLLCSGINYFWENIVKLKECLQVFLQKIKNKKKSDCSFHKLTVLHK